MNKDNRILLLALFIIIGTLISSSFESITGRVINKMVTRISISPSSAAKGKMVYLTVLPAKDGVDNEAIITNSRGVKISSLDICSDSQRCEKSTTVDFEVPNDWESGDYQIKVFDYGVQDYVKGDFTIKEVR